MCGRCNSNSPEIPGSENWGVGAPIRESFFDQFRANLVNGRHVNPAFKDDYTRILMLLGDSKLVFNHLMTLEERIAQGQSLSSDETTNWLRLSDALRFFEHQCWFPTDTLLPLGILNDNDFYFYIRRGYVLKDYGAGFQHGEFTHRLQWYAIMSAATGGFTTPIAPGWDHSPLELYISLGFNEHRTPSVWGFLLDRPGSGYGSFNHPDNFHEALLSSGLQLLRAMTSKRETKRRHEIVDELQQLLKKRGDQQDPIEETWSAVWDLKKYFDEEHLRLELDDQGVTDDKLQAKINEFHADLAKRRASVVETKKTQRYQSKHGMRQYFATGQGPVYRLSGNIIHNENVADHLARNSRGSLRKY